GASQTCLWMGSVAPVAPDQGGVTRTVTGTLASFHGCPPAAHPELGTYGGPQLDASLIDFVGSAQLIPFGLAGNAWLSFQNTLVPAILPQGGNGNGIARFTVTFDWSEGDDGGGIFQTANLLFNGVKVWSGSGFPSQPPVVQHHLVTVIDMP